MNGQVEAWTDPGVDSGHAGADHCCTIANVCWIAEGVRAPSRHPRIDVDRMMTAEGRDKVRQIVRDLPTAPWEINATERAAVLT